MNLMSKHSVMISMVVNKRLVPRVVSLIVHNKKCKVFTYDTSKELVSKPAANSGGALGGRKWDLIPLNNSIV